MGDLPRSGRDALFDVQDMLVEVTSPRVSRRSGRERSALVVAHEEVDAALGPVGRPVGTGDPGGGRGGSVGSSVERALLGPDESGEDDEVEWRPRRRSAEERAADALVRLPALMVDDVLRIAARSGDELLGRVRPKAGSAGWRQVVWVRAGVRHLLAIGASPPVDHVERLSGRARELAGLVRAWAPVCEPDGKQRRLSGELAADPTERWCRSCLRLGAKNERSQRYRAGVCRRCGDFHAAAGVWPNLEVLEAITSGEPVTEQMMQRARKRKKRRGRR